MNRTLENQLEEVIFYCLTDDRESNGFEPLSNSEIELFIFINKDKIKETANQMRQNLTQDELENPMWSCYKEYLYDNIEGLWNSQDDEDDEEE